MSRPGSSLGHNSASNYSTMSSNRDVQYFTSPNSSTKIVRERSVSPTSGRRTFKTAKYTEYNSSANGGGNLGSQLPSGFDSGYNTSSKVNVETSINQLDSLLDELKVERDLANEPGKLTPSNKIRLLWLAKHSLVSYTHKSREVDRRRRQTRMVLRDVHFPPIIIPHDSLQPMGYL